jgi:hypothetical protein
MPFATFEDVAIRLGRPLTAAEEAMAGSVIELVTGLIADAVGKDAAWAVALDPVPPTLRAVCVEKTLAVGSNPNRLAAFSEQLGAHQVSKTFPRSDVGVFLTDEEERRVRAAVYGGRDSGSVVIGSILDDLPITWDGRIAWDGGLIRANGDGE